MIYKYDENGNRTENFQHSSDGKLLIHQKRIYENSLNTELYNKNVKFDNFWLSYKYYYDNEGFLKKVEKFKINKKASVSIYTHNKKQSALFIYENRKIKDNLYLIKKYNKIEQLIEMTYPQVKKIIIYKYDSENNLLEEVIFVNDQIISKAKYYYKKFAKQENQ